jgi:glycosyltransferase involved in cell wall biosynthesis
MSTPPRFGFLGIHAGRRTDQPVSQNEILSRLFESVGYQVVRASAVKRPITRTAHQILSLLRWRRLDVTVIAVFSGPSFFIAEFGSFLARHVVRSKVVLFLHGGNLGVFSADHPARVRRAFARADLVLAPSEFLARTFRDAGFDVRVIPNVLALERYRYVERASARPQLMWMRTFHEHYDPLMAVDVLARVAEVHADATLTMGGADHGLLEATRARAVELGVLDRITFAGYLDAAAKADAFASHDVFLNTNRVDNMPVSVLEAAASGLVPVATAVGGIPSLLTDDHDSRLVPAGDVEAMVAAVLDLLADDERYARLSRGARALAERSGWPAVHQRWVEELAPLLPDVELI